MSFIQKKYKCIEEMYLDNEKLVYAFFYDYCKDSEQIREWSQKLWTKVWENFEKFRTKNKVEVQRYLRIMVRNMISDHFRDERSEQEAWKKWRYNEPQESSSIEYESELFRNPELMDYLMVAIKILSESERDLIYLSYHQQLRSAEIGQLIGISDGLVRVRLQRIRDKLKVEIERLSKEENTYA